MRYMILLLVMFLTAGLAETVVVVPTNHAFTGTLYSTGGTYVDAQTDNDVFIYAGSTTKDDPAGYINLYYNLTDTFNSLGINETNVNSITFNATYCHDGDSITPTCTGNDADGTPNGAQNVDLYNYTGTTWDNLGTLLTNDGGLEVTSTYSKSTNIADYIDDVTNQVQIRYEIDYINDPPDDSQLAIDYAPIVIDYTAVYDAPPQVTLNYPEDGATLNTTIISFNYTPTDDFGFSNCSLWTNRSGSWMMLQSNTTAVNNNTINTFNTTDWVNGNYTWNVQCYDSSGQHAWAESNRTLSVLLPVLPERRVVVDNSRYSACYHQVYYHVKMYNAISNYSISMVDASDSKEVIVEKTDEQNYYGVYNISESAPVGPWKTVVNDLVFYTGAEKNFTVNVNPTRTLGSKLSTVYYSIAKNKFSEINLYAVEGSTECNITTRESDGTLGTKYNITVTDTYSTNMNDIGGSGWSYPVLVRVECNKQFVGTRGPASEGLSVMRTPWHLEDLFYGIVTSAATTYISSPLHNVSYDVYMYGPSGALKEHHSGTLQTNQSTTVSTGAPGTVGSLRINASDDILVFYEPAGSLAIPYSSSSLLKQGLAPIYDKTGTSIYIHAPIYNTDITIRIYPYFGYSPVVGYCEHNVSLSYNEAWGDTISSLINSCPNSDKFTSGPLGSVIIEGTEPFTVILNAWSGANLDSPIYRFGEFYKKNYFVTSTGPLEYMIFSPYSSTTFEVNGGGEQPGGEFTVTYGSVEENKLNVTSSRGVAVSSASGGSNAVVVVGE